jgi:uncharacterized iron-regulated membrane protein
MKKLFQGKQTRRIRRWHRYLGLATGIQFLLWTVSGLYFSWSDIDHIHGEHLKTSYEPPAFDSLLPPTHIVMPVREVSFRVINGQPYYFINNQRLYHAKNGTPKDTLTPQEAIQLAGEHVSSDLKVKQVEYLTQVGSHHEYRERPLPAYAIHYGGAGAPIAYVSAKDGKFQTIRHRAWRWFDFLWMTHTMDYRSRDDINNWLLRIFSVAGLITVCSGLLLWIVSSKRIRQYIRQ